MSIRYLLIVILFAVSNRSVAQYDICIYGGTSAGVMAAYAAKKMGKTVLLIEPGRHLGGLSSGGLGYTDIGNKYAISGLALDFYRRLGMYYGKLEQWIFEPSVAEKTFQFYIQSAGVSVIYQSRLKEVKKENGLIQSIRVEKMDGAKASSHQVIKAKIFIDCSYEGDLMAKAGVSYSVGREANSVYGETYNGVQLRDLHQFPDGIDPYKIPGDPKSGLVWGISEEELAVQGTGDNKVQAYNFRICLTDNPANSIAITRPPDYDSSRYELLLRYLAKVPAKDLRSFLKFDRMPNHKTDINNYGPFSTDLIGANYNYPESDYADRMKSVTMHENYSKGLLYFAGHDQRMPHHLRKLMLEWGYPKDEYPDNNHWSPQLYVREARRMIGEYVMTQANCQGKEIVDDGIGLAAYTMDSHNVQRIVADGMVKNEGDVEIGGFGPYPISYRSLIPKITECKNLLVPVCLSASHIAYGSIRMEPVFMVLGQSAAVAATIAVNSNLAVQQVDVKLLQQELLDDPYSDGRLPDILVDNSDSTRVEIKGNWKVKSFGDYYGLSALVAEDLKGEAYVRFNPEIEKTGLYLVYTYFKPKYPNLSAQTRVTISDGKKETTRTLQKSSPGSHDETSGEWAPLGRFRFSKGSRPTITIHYDNDLGTVLADAVLLIPAMNRK